MTQAIVYILYDAGIYAQIGVKETCELAEDNRGTDEILSGLSDGSMTDKCGAQGSQMPVRKSDIFIVPMKPG